MPILYIIILNVSQFTKILRPRIDLGSSVSGALVFDSICSKMGNPSSYPGSGTINEFVN